MDCKMSETNRAICPCTEGELVVALLDSRNVFHNWGFGTWFLTILIGLISGGMWFFVVGGYLVVKYLNLKPSWNCNRCGAAIEPHQLR